MAERYRTLAEFWPFYLSQHRRPLTQALHVAGSLAALSFLGLAVAFRSWWFVLVALVAGYAFAWVGHFFVEHNRPATFAYPVKSFLSDWRLLWVVVTGRLEREVARTQSQAGGTQESGAIASMPTAVTRKPSAQAKPGPPSSTTKPPSPKPGAPQRPKATTRRK